MLISQSQYAKLRCVSKNAVSKAIKAGRIFLVDGKVDPDLANRDWEANSNHRQQRKPKKEQESTAQTASAAASGSPALDGPPETDAGSFMEAQRQREWERVRKDRQGRKLRDGQLLERSEIIRLVGDLIVSAKTNLRGIGAKLAPDVAAETDAAKCQAMVDAEVDEALEAISRWTPPAMTNDTRTRDVSVAG